MEASGSPPKYRFILFYSLNLLAQFDKPYPKTKRKEKKTNPRHRDTETQKSLKNETPRHIKNASEISRSGQNFPRPTVFEVAFCSPTNWFLN